MASVGKQKQITLFFLVFVSVCSAQPPAKPFPKSALSEVAQFWERQTWRPWQPPPGARASDLSVSGWVGPSEDALSVAYWMALVPSGRQLLEGFALEALRSNQVHVYSSHSDQAQQIVGSRGGAGYYVGGKIFVDDRAPLFAVLGFLFHEWIHAQHFSSSPQAQQEGRAMQALLESFLDFKAGMGPSRQRIEQDREALYPVLMASEHVAFKAQNQFISELIALWPGFRQVVNDLVFQAQWPPHPVTRDDFRHLMKSSDGFQIPAQVVDAYLNTIEF